MDKTIELSPAERLLILRVILEYRNSLDYYTLQQAEKLSVENRLKTILNKISEF